MDYKIFDDFKREQPVPQAKIIAYKDKLPKELLSVWEELGYGTFMRGYFKIVDPAVYQSILEESYFIGKDSIPMMVTGFGDIITWEENKYIGLVKYRKGQFNIISSGFKFYFSNLGEEFYLNKYFNVKQYQEAYQQYGELNFDECFG